MDAKTRLCAVIGNPIGHSLSPQIHNAAFEALGLNYAYVAFEVSDVPAAIAGVRGLGIRGLSITIPHKVTSMAEVDEVDPMAADIGCINTILNDDGKLYGYNTDGLGALNSLLEAGCDLSGKKILMLGSGGAARAIAITLAHRTEMSRLSILGILEDERKKLAEDASAKTAADVVTEDLNDSTIGEFVPEHDVLIQCTPIGMHPKVEQSLVPRALLREGLWIFDVVYNPLETKLLKEGRENGCHTVPGIEMFVRQAVAQFELWTKEDAPYEIMHEVVLNALKGKKS